MTIFARKKTAVKMRARDIFIKRGQLEAVSVVWLGSRQRWPRALWKEIRPTSDARLGFG